MGWSDSVDAILVSRGARAHLCIVGVLACVFIVDLAAVVLLRAAPSLIHDGANGTGTPTSWTPAGLVHGIQDFKSDTVDMVALCLARSVVLSLLCWLAILVGTPRLDDLIAADGRGSTAATGSGGPSMPQNGAAAPLLINAAPTGAAAGAQDAPVVAGASRSSAARGSAQAAGLTLTTDVKEEHLTSHTRKERAALRKNVVLAIMFIFTAGVQVVVGIKCIGFDNDWAARPRLHTVQAVLFLCSLGLINLESFLSKRLVMVATTETGFLIPEFHPHRLFFYPKRLQARCDLCRNRVTQAYVCSLCNFDCCPACFNKKDKATGEGIIRGDRGVKHVGALSFGTYMRRGTRLMAPELPMFLLALSLLGANSMVRLFMPNYQGSIIQDIINAHTACVDEAYNLTRNATKGECAHHRQSFLDNVLTYLLLSFATSVLSALRQLCFMVVARRVILHIRGRVFESIMDQDIAFFDGMRTGDLQQRVASDVQRTASPLYSSLPQLLSNVILLVGGVVMCFVTSWRLSMLAFTTALPIMHVTRAYAEWSSKINREIVQDFSDGNAIANEAISNLRTVRAVSSEPFEKRRYRATLNKGFAKGIKDATIGSLATFFNGGLDLGAGVLILWYGGLIAMEVDGDITVGDLIKYQLYYNMMNNSIQALSGVLNTFTRAAGAAERVLSVIDLPPDIDPKAGAPVDVAVRSWGLELREVHFYYQMRPSNTVLAGLSFDVPDGTVCALVGPSGGGKSTVMHLLLRFYDPHEGAVLLDGVDYRQLSFPSVHQRTGVVAQDSQLFNCSVAENITYGAPEDVSEAEIEQAARAAQAWHFVSEFEDGLHTKVGERGQRLSGGQRQRIAIARCLLRKPRLLLLDEATSALDAESEAAVQKALDALIWSEGGTEGGTEGGAECRECGPPTARAAVGSEAVGSEAGRAKPTVVLVAHRLSTVVNAHKIVVVDKGRAAEQGTHDHLLANDGKYADLVRTQLQKQAEMGSGAPAGDRPAGITGGGIGLVWKGELKGRQTHLKQPPVKAVEGQPVTLEQLQAIHSVGAKVGLADAPAPTEGSGAQAFIAAVADKWGVERLPWVRE